jgi:hypothetical protein
MVYILVTVGKRGFHIHAEGDGGPVGCPISNPVLLLVNYSEGMNTAENTRRR